MVVHGSAMTLLKISSPATTSPSSSAICQIETGAFAGFESRSSVFFTFLMLFELEYMITNAPVSLWRDELHEELLRWFKMTDS